MTELVLSWHVCCSVAIWIVWKSRKPAEGVPFCVIYVTGFKIFLWLNLGRPSSVDTVATVAYCSGCSFSSGVDLATNKRNMKMNMNMLLVAKAIICFHFHVWEFVINLLWVHRKNNTKFSNENKCMFGCNHKQGSRNDALYKGETLWQSLNLAVCSQNLVKFVSVAPAVYYVIISIMITTCLI